MVENEYQRELLTAALESRTKEVIEYQVNIDNFRLAIDRIKDKPELQSFKENLEGLLSSSLVEQQKAQILLDVIKIQLE